LKRPGVCILGGGFAGLACANALDARRFAVTLVDARRSFEFLPNIHEILSGVKRPAGVRLPLAEAMGGAGHHFVHARATAIEPARHRLHLGRTRIDADYLVVATGAVDADYGVSGVAEHALGFKSAAAVDAIRARLRRIADTSESRVTVIGGGLEGIEALGEILRAYRGRLRRITLVEARSRLLADSRRAVHEHLAALCANHGVELIFNDRVKRITAKTVLLESGRRLRSHATIWTGGPAPAPLLSESGLARPGAWATVKASLEHEEFVQVFVVGDAAQAPQSISKQAYHAIDMGRCAAANIERHARGKRLHRYRPSPRPTLLSFGDLDTLLITSRGALAGPALATGKEAVFAGVMADLDRRHIHERGTAVLDRSLQASKRLLWPALRDPRALRRGARLRALL
jgi:NADH dehydrogenase